MKLTFGDHMRNARENANLKQVDVKEKTSISNFSLSNWEKGKSEPCIEDAITLAELYGVTLDELFGHRTSNVYSISAGKLSTIETRIILKLRSLNNEGQLKALEYIDDLTGNIKYTEKEAVSSA